MPRLNPMSCKAVVIPILSIIFYRLSTSKYDQLPKLLHFTAKASFLIRFHSLGQPFPQPPFTLYSTQVVLPNKAKPTTAYVSIDKHGKINAVSLSILSIPALFRHDIVDVSPLTVMPGLIDPHVHINSPGKDHWEGFESAMRAAVAGGTTTILDMPINSVPATVDFSSYAQKLDSLMGSPAITNIGFIGGVIPQNVNNFSDLLQLGVVALKSFLVDTQSPDFQMISLTDFRTAVSTLHKWHDSNPATRYVPYILHAELDDHSDLTGSRLSQLESFDHSSYASYEKTRPANWETDAVNHALTIVNGSKVHVHIAHVSAAEVTDYVRDARRKGLNGAQVSSETCPHYLLFSKDEITTGNTLYKCAPPIRGSKNRARVVDETFLRPPKDRVIDIVVSDHSPCEVKLKNTSGNLTAAWGGIAGLQYRLQATAKAAFHEGLSVVDLNRVLSTDVARLFNLDSVKGSLTPGKDADILIWDPQKPYEVSPEKCEHRVKTSAFDRWKLQGDIWYTLVRGHVAFERYEDGNWYIRSGNGRYLERDTDGKIRERNISSLRSPMRTTGV